MENDFVSSYQIIDEPQGSKLSHTTVDPMWPLLGFMLGGALFSWLWSAINGIALNSPNRNRELFTIGVAISVFIAMYTGLGALMANGSVDGMNPEYIKVAIISVELIFCYKIYLMQRGSFDIYEYFNGKVASPVIGLFLALLMGRKLETFALILLLPGGQ